MGNLNAVSDLHLCTVGPLILQLTKFKRLIYCVIIELFLVDLICEILESKIEPVEDVKNFDRLLE